MIVHCIFESPPKKEAVKTNFFGKNSRVTAQICSLKSCWGCMGLVPLRIPWNNTRTIAALWVKVKTSATPQHPAHSSGAVSCRGQACVIFPLYFWEYREKSVHQEFSQTLNYMHNPSQVIWCLRGDIFTSFSLHIWICRKFFWPMFLLQSKSNRLQCSRKTAKMATIRFIERKMMVI